jgi:hypothetical protein
LVLLVGKVRPRLTRPLLALYFKTLDVQNMVGAVVVANKTLQVGILFLAADH